MVPPQWTALADRAYRLSLGGNAELCGSVPQPLTAAVLAAGGSARGSGLASPCAWEADAAALLALKAGMQVPLPAGALADWGRQEGSPCREEAWAGISCRGGRVAILNLAGQGLRLGSLEPLGELSALEMVLLSGNTAANATLPASWGALRHLASADLSGTGVGGPLPEAWAQLSSLKQLHLGGNELEGPLPPSWAALTALAEL